MKKIALFICLLIVKLSISQTGYPVKLRIGNDTVIAFNQHQFDSIVSTFIDYDECKVMQDSLRSQIGTYIELNAQKDKQISILKQESSTNGQIELEDSKVLSDDDKIIKMQKTQIGTLKIERTGLCITILTAAILIIIHK